MLNDTKLNALDKRISAFIRGYRQNVTIFSDDSEEINCLLNTQLSKYKNEEVLQIYVSTRYSDKKDFFKNLSLSLLKELSANNGSLDYLINETKITFPVTTTFIQDTLKKNNVTFLDVLEVLNKFINESKRRCLLIIDEFTALKEIFPGSLKDFSKFIILQKNCMIILTSSAIREGQRILGGDLNLLFGNFEKIFLNETSFEENYIYLQTILLPLTPSPFFISFFINIIGANTTYYNLFAKTIKNNYRLNNEKEIIISTLRETLFNRQTYFFQKFADKMDYLHSTHKDTSPLRKVLTAISQGYCRKKEITALNISAAEELNNILHKLQELGYIENLGNIYKIKDSLFAFWLSCLFQPIFVAPLKQTDFCAVKIKESIELFEDDFYKQKLSRILELLSVFKNDSLTIGKTKYKFSGIEKTKVIPYPERNMHILIGEGKEIIFAGIKEKDTEDADLIEFINRGRGIKGKGVKKIFISLQNFTSTSRLIAKNHKLIAWDINDINHLLKIYNKPLIPLEQFKETKNEYANSGHS
jgi:hypothetical protein